VSKPESPYLAFIVGLHVATALAMIIYFWRDWVRIVVGFFTSLRDRRIATPDQRLAWLIIIATIPVGIAGLLLEHLFRVVFSKPVLTALFLAVNGLILLAGEWRRRRAGVAEVSAPVAGTLSERELETEHAVAVDRRLSGVGYPKAFALGASQILALLPGISRDGIVTVSGMFGGISREDAVRFSFLLSAPVILAAGVLKVGDLTGPLGAGIGGQVLVGSLLSFAGAYVSVRFLTRYFAKARSLAPFGIYCLAAGLASLIYLLVR
jgi:undecaprenyl-diphosphatase